MLSMKKKMSLNIGHRIAMCCGSDERAMAEVKSAPEQRHQSKFGPVGHPVYTAALHLESSGLFLVQASSPKIAGSGLLRLSCFFRACSAVCLFA
jgi:hypothetical protein